jgi:hypothetical protein
VGRRQRQRRSSPERTGAATSEYLDAEGNALILRNGLSAGTLRRLAALERTPAATHEDLWQRQGEFLFERLVVSWTIAGLPLTERELLGRYRMADAQTRGWVRETIVEHLRRHQPEARV